MLEYAKGRDDAWRQPVERRVPSCLSPDTPQQVVPIPEQSPARRAKREDALDVRELRCGLFKAQPKSVFRSRAR
jgi:hypothetical protein